MTAHPTCVFPSLVHDTHVVGFALDVIIRARVFNIRAFNVVSKVCNLVSKKVKPLYITSLEEK